MSDDVCPDDLSSDRGQPVGALLPLPLDFEAHYVVHQDAYHAYAQINLGSRRSAEEAVHRGFLEILANWETLLHQDNLEQQTWAIMRRVVTDQLERDNRPPAFRIDAPIAQALRNARQRLQAMHSSSGLHEAIAELPPRQFDVIVMRHLLGYSAQRISWYLGLNERTVDYHGRKGKERLRILLGLPAETKKEQKEEDGK